MTTVISTNNPSILLLARRVFLLPVMALIFAFSTLSLTTSTPAEAGFGKKVKVAGKVFKKVEKAGRKLSKKKGVIGKLGKGMQKSGRAGRKGTHVLRKGMKKANGAVNRQLAKSKLGRGIQKGANAYKKVRKSTVNKAFKRCRTELCNDARDVVDAAVPG